MTRRMLVVLLALGLFAAMQLSAVPLEFSGYIDDYVIVRIDGNPVIAYDSHGSADVFGSADLAEGWHDLDIVYQNRWGTSELSFAQRYNPSDPYSLVPLNYLRSRNESDTQYINGLYAEYYSIEGDFLQAVYGEGPIAHGYDGNGPLYTHYEDLINRLWAGSYTGSVTLEERLSGDIWIGANPPDPNATPEPGSLTLLGLGLAVFAPAALRRRFMRTP